MNEPRDENGRITSGAIRALLSRNNLGSSPDENDPCVDPILAELEATIRHLDSLQKEIGAKKASDGKYRGASWSRTEVLGNLKKSPKSNRINRKISVFESHLPKRASAESFIVDALIHRLDEFYQKHYSSVNRKHSLFIRDSMELLGWPAGLFTKERIRDSRKRN